MDLELKKLLENSKRYKCGFSKKSNSIKSKKNRGKYKKFFHLLLLISIWGGVAFSILLLILFFQMPPLKTALSKPRKTSIVILDRNNMHVRTINDLYGLPIEVENLPDHVWQAIVATEDKRFFYHFGIDPIGLLRAFFTNIFSGKVRQGGSTITQQVAKNIFLTPKRSIKRKIQELMVAFWLEARFSKKQILSMYLNRVSLVSGKYGLNTASKELFNKDAKKLSIAEASIISAMLKAPSKYHPYRDQVASEKRTRLILKNLYQQEYISGDDYAIALDSLKIIKPKKPKNIRYFTDFVLKNIISRIGKVESDLIVKTTLDLKLHQKSRLKLNEILDKNKDKNVSQGAIVFMNKKGEILTMIGGANYGKSQFNRAVDAKRQPGSAFKPFVYLTAFENGFTPETMILDSPVQVGKWRPANFNNRYFGQTSLRYAFAKSMNSVPVRLAQNIGLNEVIKTAKRLGIASPFRYDFSLVLGASELNLTELVGAYIPFANGGKGVKPFVIKEIKMENGKVLYARMENNFITIISSENLQKMQSIFSSVVNQGTGKSAFFEGLLGGKTGTSQNSRDAWFVGFTNEIIGGVWLGNDNNSPMKKVYGGNLPAEIFKLSLEN
ncbi:MAG: transglycosylase domain-containing protein [Alphaproteobacteria bacterium]